MKLRLVARLTWIFYFYLLLLSDYLPAGMGKWGGTELAGCVCEAGYFRAGDRCVPCGPGTKKSTWGTDTCDQCSPGQYSEFTNASIGCEYCPSGKALPDQENTCAICSPGKYAYSYGNTICSLCPAGKYQLLNESTSCINCPSGKAGTVTNATNEAAGCPIFCIPGTYSTDTFPSTTCTNCAAGYFANLHQASTCAQCPGGAMSPPGSQNLTNCSCLE